MPTVNDKRKLQATVMLVFFFCRDLAVDLRMKLGDWFRVVQLLKSGSGGGSLYSQLNALFFIYLCCLSENQLFILPSIVNYFYWLFVEYFNLTKYFCIPIICLYEP